MSSSNAVLPASRQPFGPQREIPRSPIDIRTDMDQTSTRIQENLGLLVDRVKPVNVARRTADAVRANTLTPEGRPRAEVLGAAVAGLVGIGVLVWRARR